MLYWLISFGLRTGAVDAGQLENEIGHGGEVQHDDEDVADVGFAANNVSGEEEKGDGDWHGDDGDVEFGVAGLLILDYDEELDGETEEEEEVEFEEGNVDLGLIISI